MKQSERLIVWRTFVFAQPVGTEGIPGHHCREARSLYAILKQPSHQANPRCRTKDSVWIRSANSTDHPRRDERFTTSKAPNSRLGCIGWFPARIVRHERPRNLRTSEPIAQCVHCTTDAERFIRSMFMIVWEPQDSHTAESSAAKCVTAQHAEQKCVKRIPMRPSFRNSAVPKPVALRAIRSSAGWARRRRVPSSHIAYNERHEPTKMD